MCGIHFSISLHDGKASDNVNERHQNIRARGPDNYNKWTTTYRLSSGHMLDIKLCISVLGLRGDGVTAQPIEGKRGILGWNGQIFQGIPVALDENDTQKLSAAIDSTGDIFKVLSGTEGPYACIFYDTSENLIYFQCDPLCRRSLLVQEPSMEESSSTKVFTLCSVRDSPEMGTMRELEGGQGGTINLSQIEVKDDGSLDMSKALAFHRLQDMHKSAWTQVAPLTMDLPSADTDMTMMDTEVDRFIEKLSNSIEKRILNIPQPPHGQARVAVLFSGGVDCSLLARLINRHIPTGEPIDLLNVAFLQAGALPTDNIVPDRLSGLEAAGELRKASPEREWRLVEIDISYEECQQHRANVLNLMYPSCTEMDLSLAYPLYFASRGKGYLRDENGEVPYTTQAKVYISGLGADEQLAGYSRHRIAFKRGGYYALLDELQMDLDRIPIRNLARDDRIISSHARDARYPYLDLDFIAYLSSLPVWLKCDLNREGGDKALLRAAAAKLGLKKTSGRVKRAMQFGTRSAKMAPKIKGPKKGAQIIDTSLL